MNDVQTGYKSPHVRIIHFTNVHQCSILSLSFPEMRQIASLCFVGFHISEGAHGNVLEMCPCNVIKGTNTSPRLVATKAGYHPNSYYTIKVSLWVGR